MKKMLLPAFLVGTVLTCGLAQAEIVYISNSGDDSITELTQTGPDTFSSQTVNLPTVDLSNPVGIAIFNDDIFVANAGTREIAEFNASGDFLGNYASTGKKPTGIVFDEAGNLYVTNKHGKDIQEIMPPTTTDPNTTTVKIDHTRGIKALALDTVTGDLIGVTSDSHKLTEINSAGVASKIKFTGPGLCSASGIAIDSAGNIFIANTGHDEIEEITNGIGSIFAKGGPLDVASALSVDAAGNVFVTDYCDNSVTEYNSSGKVINTFSSDFSGPTGIAISNSGSSTTVVPEPSTYAMLFAGLGVLLFLNRRRRLQLARI